MNLGNSFHKEKCNVCSRINQVLMLWNSYLRGFLVSFAVYMCWMKLKDLCMMPVADSRVLLGGGWPEMVMAKEVDDLARKTPRKKSLAIEASSRALQAIPTIIADNAGLDNAGLIAQLRAEHQKEGSTAGIDVISGAVSE